MEIEKTTNLNKKNIKAIFIDLDGTLLRSSRNLDNISKDDILYLKKLQNNNIYVVITTGRLKKWAVKANRKIKINDYGNYLISGGGSCLEEMEPNKIIKRGLINISETKELIDFATKYDAAINIGKSNKLFTINTSSIKLKALAKFLRFQIYDIQKLIIINKYQKIGILMKSKKDAFNLKIILEKEFKNLEFHISGRAQLYIEATLKGFNKGAMIKEFCKYKNIDIKNTVGIGDSMNDFEMMKSVGHPIAMKNSVKEIKSKSIYITDSNKKSGVSKSEKYLKILNNE